MSDPIVTGVKTDAQAVETKAVSIFQKTKAWVIAHVPHAISAVAGFATAKFAIVEAIVKKFI